jgi:hypothetical protein
MDRVMTELRHRAAACLGAARRLRSTVPAKALPAFLPVSLTDPYLARLARPGFNLLGEIAEVSQLRRQCRLAARAYLGRF